MILATSVIKHMELFFKDPSRFDRSYQMDNWFVKSRTRNPQLADLGLPFRQMDNKSKVRPDLACLSLFMDTCRCGSMSHSTSIADVLLIQTGHILQWEYSGQSYVDPLVYDCSAVSRDHFWYILARCQTIIFACGHFKYVPFILQLLVGRRLCFRPISKRVVAFSVCAIIFQG